MAVRARGRSTRSLVLLLVTISLVTITIDYRQGASGPLGAIGRGALTGVTPQGEIGGRVIASGVSNLEWTVTIDVGTSDGVRENMPVLDPDGLAGRVIEVTSSSAVVLLAIDPQSHVSGKIVSSDLIGTLQGAGGGNDLQ